MTAERPGRCTFRSKSQPARTFEGAGHNARDWAARFELRVRFLMDTS